MRVVDMINVDKRSTSRMAQKFSVDVYNDDLYMGRCKTRDIHSDGAFIDDCVSEQSDVLDLYFLLDEVKHDPVHLKGMVVRRPHHGAGVLFSYIDPEFRRLVKKLYASTGDQRAC